MFVKQKELVAENFTIQLINQATNQPVYTKAITNYTGGLLQLALDSTIKSKSDSGTMFYLKINVPQLKALGEEKIFPTEGKLTITDVRSIFKGQLGEENASKKHTMVDYDKISWFYANTTGIKPDEELTIEIWQALTAKESFLGRDDKMKHTLKAKVDDSGVLKAKIEWNKIQKIKDTRQIYIQVKDKDGNTLYDADGNYNEAKVTLVYTPTIIKMAENKSMVKVASGTSVNSTTCVCKKDDLIWGNKVSCEFRKKVVAISKSLGLPQEKNEGANWLMAVMALETEYTFSPTAGSFKSNPDDNREGGFVGLIQFGKGASIDIDIKRSELMKMTAEKQLDYVEKYFNLKTFKGLLVNKTALYLAVNYPNSCKHASEKNYVVYDSTKSAYDSNPMFKKEKDESYIDEKGKKKYYKGKEGKSYVWEFEEAINEIAKLGESKKSKKFSCGFGNTPINAKDIITYRIYSNGKIEKHIPKVIKEEYKTMYKYVYHDAKKIEHDLGVGDFKRIKNTHGASYGGETVDLIDIKHFESYSKGDVKYKIMKWNSGGGNRYYLNDKTLASFLGSLLNCGFEDIVFNGFSNSKGGAGVSKTHFNGFNGDLRYLCTDKSGSNLHLDVDSKKDGIYGWKDMDKERMIKLVNALHLFGWKKFYSWKFNDELLPHSTQLDHHNHHLHMYSYEPNFEEINEK